MCGQLALRVRRRTRESDNQDVIASPRAGLKQSPSPFRSKVRHHRDLGLTLIESLVATVILAMVAAGAAMALSTGLGAQRDANLQLLAGIAAEQQVSTIMTAPYASSSTFAGIEAVGGMLSPPRVTAALIEVRDPLGPAFSAFGRTTVVTAVTRTFPQYQNFAQPGWRIQVTVTNAQGRVYAALERFRAQELQP